MSTADKNLKYAMRIYNSPIFESWNEWFAWYPVRVVEFKQVDLSTFGVATHFIKIYNWAWLRKIARRKVVDYLDGPGRESAGKKTYYEYTTLMELLKSGH